MLIVFGASAIWQIISIKQSMDLATYEAARYLAREGRDIGSLALPYYDPERWRVLALERIDGWMRDQIRRNPFIGEGDRIEIDVIPPTNLDCNPWLANLTNHERVSDDIRFTVTTNLTVESPIRLPFMPPISFTLQEKHSDLVECPRFRRDPPDEGDIF